MNDNKLLNTINEFRKLIDNVEDKNVKKLLNKYYEAWLETFKKYNFEKARKVYHEK